jgi:hypothetical protein
MFRLFLLVSTLVSTATFAKSTTKILPWLRLQTDVANLRANFNHSWLAYTDGHGLGLYVLNTKTSDIFEVSTSTVGPSFFWSPDGARLVYRALSKDPNKNTIESRVLAYDTMLHRSVPMDTIKGFTGFLTYDPRDHRMFLMHREGVRSHKLTFPDQRLAKWQMNQKSDRGRWVAAPGGMLWLTQDGLAMQKLSQEEQKIESFVLSDDGKKAAWATTSGQIFVSDEGKEPLFVDWGRDPSWHNKRQLLVFAGGRMVGNKAARYDLKIADIGAQKPAVFISNTEDADERWPVWNEDKIIYTLARTTDLYQMKFEDQ